MSQKSLETSVNVLGLRHFTVRVLTPHPHVLEQRDGRELSQSPLKHRPPPQLPSGDTLGVMLAHRLSLITLSESGILGLGSPL
jgi:hypothetical protein